ncbi:unnamed protein product [Rotaria sordida]|uniref:Ninjurin-2 n=2 Tax=Rotaria sordida TaxID=392033 RepID=A0A819FPT6_9BILA|nr:unnamed protein product [Rotaria sordida]
MTSYNQQRAPFSPPMYPEPNDNDRPMPPPRAEFARHAQQEPLVPPRMDRQDGNNTTRPNRMEPASENLVEFSCNYNRYATKKTIGHGLLEFALLTSNAMQLRTLINQKQRDTIWLASLILVCISILAQVILAYILIIVGKGNIQNPEKQEKLEKYNNIALFITTLVSMINVIINMFMSTTSSTSYLDTQSLELLKKQT